MNQRMALLLYSILTAAACLAALASASQAAPVRVGVFIGVSASGRLSATHTATHALATLLANPDSANLGPALVKIQGGFVTRPFGVEEPSDTAPLVREPTLAQKNAFVNALDSLDVLVFPSNSGLADLFTEPGHREKLEWFFKTRGVVSLGWSLDRSTSWRAWDSLHGTRLSGWMLQGMATIRRDTAAAQEPAARFLNRGLPDTARFRDEWISFTTTGAAIRAVPGLKVTMSLDETSFTGTVNNRRMGDHPNTWYRESPEGGRFFYTGNGYRASLFTGVASVADSTGETTTVPETNFLRRQLYNAILWAAGVDSNGVVSVRGAASGTVFGFSDAARLSFPGGALAISVLRDGAHEVEVRSLDGRLAAARRGTGRAEYRFEGLRPGVYTVAVTSGGRRLARLVTTP